jgi:hypothetical protein
MDEAGIINVGVSLAVTTIGSRWLRFGGATKKGGRLETPEATGGAAGGGAKAGAISPLPNPAAEAA